MKNDRDLQNQLTEEGVAKGTSQERAYHIVFNSLEREPLPNLSPQFADIVVARLMARQNKLARRDSYFFVVGISLIVVVAIIGAWLSGFTLDLGIFKFLSGYPKLVVFGAAFVAFIHWLDRKFVRSKNLI